MEEFDLMAECLAVEVYNNVCQLEYGRGLGEQYYERMLWNNQKMFCAACDDTHPEISALGGYIQVKATNFSHDSIFDAMEKGSYYSSNGVVIHDFYVEGGIAYVECEPCSHISFHGDNFKGYSVYDDGKLTKVQTPIGQAKYICVKCQNADNHLAWTQPIWM